jgi:hypothetical protein
MRCGEGVRVSRMREIRKSGLKRAEEAVSLPLRYSTNLEGVGLHRGGVEVPVSLVLVETRAWLGRGKAGSGRLLLDRDGHARTPLAVALLGGGSYRYHGNIKMQ